MKIIDKIYQYICTSTFDMIKSSQNTLEHMKSSDKVAFHLNIYRSNASSALNKLVRNNKLLKVGTRPIYYLAIEPLEISGILDYINKYNQNIEEVINIINNSKPNYKVQDVFSKYIGYNTDLRTQIKQAKAAVLYPPNGLHILINGDTGTGKTYFASIIHEFACSTQNFGKDAPYISFNCADYSENKQLLISKLFGYNKGAFTGADKDSIGIIEKANGGILFLDEIHRLPPEGQEMLFSVIDHGKFARLGDSEANRSVQLLIIVATTENIENVILKTFLRRIPMIIRLPQLEERGINIRFNFIRMFFHMEAIKVGRIIVVNGNVMRILLLYKCIGNIGQLKNDIKLICANAFIDYIGNNYSDYISISIDNIISLSDRKFYDFNDKMDKIPKEFNENIDYTFYPEIDNKDYLIDSNELRHESFYTELLSTIRHNIDNGIVFEDMKYNILKHFQVNNIKKSNSNDILNKIVTPEIMQIVTNVINDNHHRFNFFISNKVIYSLALHLEGVISRLSNGNDIKYTQSISYNSKMSVEYDIANQLRDLVNKTINVLIPEQELHIIATFIYSIQYLKYSDAIPILIIGHGHGIASNMEKLAKNILSLDNIYSVDMLIDNCVEDVLSYTCKCQYKFAQKC